MARLLLVTTVIASLTLAACGGGGDSSTTTTPLPDQAALHWTRCAQSYTASTSGMSCAAAARFVRDAVPRVPTPGNGTRAAILKSNPRSFNIGPFDCAEFPLESGFGWHVLCDQGTRHVSFYITP